MSSLPGKGKPPENGERSATEATLENSRDRVFRALIENASDEGGMDGISDHHAGFRNLRTVGALLIRIYKLCELYIQD